VAVTVEEEDPESEAQRFGALLTVLIETVPELGGWWAESNDELPEPMTLCQAGIEAGVFRLFDEDDQLRHVNTVWPRMLRFIELAFRVEDILWSDETREADAVTIDAFATCGLVCDLTRARDSIETLLPWMGPETVESARREVELHWRSRGFGVEDVAWAKAGTAFVELDHRPEDLVPAPMGRAET
jgi:hypothetical protein